jgi:hypothetical protein
MIGITPLLVIAATAVVLTADARENGGWEVKLWSARERIYRMLH